MNDFSQRLAQLDPTLFDHIPSQSSRRDQRSLLALHFAFKKFKLPFTWLEIGSHLGGSLQVLVADPDCRGIISIDSRPPMQPDQRGMDYEYHDNSTERMLTLLKKVPGAVVDKITAIESGTEAINPQSLLFRPDFCFVDGEHTDVAALRDARFCLAVVPDDACIAFHDAGVIYRALDTFVRDLEAGQRPFRAYNLPDSVFVVELGNCRLCECDPIRSLLQNNYQGYLWSLMTNDWYRETLNRPFFRFLRRLGWIKQPGT